MTKSVRLLLMGAALTGFMAGQSAFAQAAGGDDAKKDTATKGDKSTKSKKRQACLQGPGTPAKAKAAADPPRARTIAKARVSAGQMASPCQKGRQQISSGPLELQRTGGSPLVLYFQKTPKLPAIFISFYARKSLQRIQGLRRRNRAPHSSLQPYF